jgi:hypothetical protein
MRLNRIEIAFAPLPCRLQLRVLENTIPETRKAALAGLIPWKTLKGTGGARGDTAAYVAREANRGKE